MPDPVLRIPVDDEAFKRYLELFQRYQTQLEEQPEIWQASNDATRDGVAANLALADAIGQSVSAAIRLGDVQDRNARKRKRERDAENANEQRAASWRRRALDHVQELSRTADTVVRSFGSFASGSRGAGGLFGMIADGGKGLGGDIGAVVSLLGHTLNAGYEINSAVRDKGQFARGIGTSISAQEGFHNNLGAYTNTDQGIDAVMNARNDPRQWAAFSTLGVNWNSGSNAELYANVLRKQTQLAKRHLDKNGNIKFYETDPLGGSAFGTSHEDLNRLVKAPNLEKAIQEALSFKSPLGDKQTDAATKTVTAMDTLTTRTVDAAQAMTVSLNPAIDRVTDGLNKLANVVNKIVSLLPSSWTSGAGGAASAPAAPVGSITGNSASADAAWRAKHPIAAFFGMHFTPYAPDDDNYHPHTLDQIMAGTNYRSGATGGKPAATPDALRAKAAIEKLGGHITSIGRTRAEQAELYAKYQRYLNGKGPWAPPAAPPEHSAHESGNALDIRRGQGITRETLAAALRSAGVKYKAILNEKDHFHITLANEGNARMPQRSGSGNINVTVKTTALAGHQTAVSVNNTAKGS